MAFASRSGRGIELRQAGIQVPILIMGGYYGRAWRALRTT